MWTLIGKWELPEALEYIVFKLNFGQSNSTELGPRTVRKLSPLMSLGQDTGL